MIHLIKFLCVTLSCQLTPYLIAKADTPLNISITFPIGSFRDTQSGEAHLVEHLKFKTVSAHNSKVFEDIPGATFNAFTYKLKTTYQFRANQESLPAVLETFRNIASPLEVNQANFERERQIVKQEILQRTRSHPDTEYYQQLDQQLYAGTKLAHWPVGQINSINALTLRKVKQWNKVTYERARALVTIYGDLDKTNVQKVARNILPDKKFRIMVIDTENPSREPDRTLRDQPAILSDPEIKFHAAKPFNINAQSERITATKFIWKRIYKASSDWRNNLTARSLLIKAIKSRLPEGLHDRIGEENRIVNNWDLSISWPIQGYWQLNFSATLAEGAEVDAVKKAIDNYLYELSTKGISEKSFMRLLKRTLLSEKRKWQNPEVAASSFADDVAAYGYRFAWNWPRHLALLKRTEIKAFLQILKKPLREATLIIKPKEISNE